jgi:hypothetical protein
LQAEFLHFSGIFLKYFTTCGELIVPITLKAIKTAADQKPGAVFFYLNV